MKKERRDRKKGVSRREFVKKMAYLAPAVAVLIIPKYTAAQGCTGVCTPQCPPRCEGRCTTLCPPRCEGR
ncbi:MAG TPA: hypothetical protein VJ624_11365 [Thermodesulfobacteriota bacterium]|nr:hypothetical protein [Thermodesulfobacteriota bacterium]